MPVADRAELVKLLLAAFMANDRAAAERLLAEDFSFTSPYDDGIDRAAYFERCWPTSSLFRSQTVEHVCAGDDGAYLTYLAERNDGVCFRNTEYFTFAGDRIASVEVFFGASYKDGQFQQATPT